MRENLLWTNSFTSMFIFSVVVDVLTDCILSFLFPVEMDILVPVASQKTDVVIVICKFPNMYGRLKQIIKSCNVKWWQQQKHKKKKTVGLIRKKNNFGCTAHFFCTFVCCCFSWWQCQTSRNFLVTRYMEEMLSVVVHFLCCRSFTPWWPLAFLILLLPLIIQTNWSPLLYYLWL